MTAIPSYVELREPSFREDVAGHLLALYDPARGILKIKRKGGPEVVFDLAEFDVKSRESMTQSGESVL
mgnify:CR=1 FL=1